MEKMAYHQMHLNKNRSGLDSRTACGRNVFLTPLSCGWEGFKLTPADQQCEKCASSNEAELNARRDFDQLEPEAPDAWKTADDALIAAFKMKK